MATTATQLTPKFLKDIKRISEDRVQGKVVKQLRALFANAPKIRASLSVRLPAPSKGTGSISRTVRVKKKVK